MEIALTVMGKEASSGTVSVSEVAFSRAFNEALVHQVITAYMAGGRQGTRAQKTRAEVRGGGVKPWKQKGTGRARAGTIRSPLWRKGGIIFAAKPQDHSQKVNRKMYQGAIRCIFSELIRQERVVVVESIALAAPKTKLLIEQLKPMNLKRVLIVIDQPDEILSLAARNVPDIEVLNVHHVDPVKLIAHDRVMITVPALKILEEKLA